MQTELQALADTAKLDTKGRIDVKVLAVTSGKEWRRLRVEGVVVELPSGMVARLRPVGLMALLSMGRIPDELTPIVVELMTRDKVDPEKAIGDALKSAKSITQLYDVVCQECFIEPRLVAEAKGDDEIEMLDVSDEDKQFILTFANAPSSALRSFRDEQAGSAQPAPDGEGLRKTA